ncbi:MAG: alpha/beta hydrolase [Bdellovibrionales bacterium]
MSIQLKRHQGSIFDYNEVEINSKGLDLVLFHGFGADSDDLLGLLNYMDLSKVRNAYFPNGIMEANGVPSGRAWFPIDIEALESAMMTGSHRDLTGDIPEPLFKLCEEMENQLLEELNLNPTETIIGGFSQGAMVSTHIALYSQHNWRALVLLSGTYLGKNQWSSQMEIQKNKFPIFQSHGVNDALLSPKDALSLGKAFKSSGFNVDFIEFGGGHEIPLNVLKELGSFINTL